MDWVSTVSRYYKAGYYSADDVRVFVAKGKITPANYKVMTGGEYTATEY